MFSADFIQLVIVYGLAVIGIVEAVKRTFKLAEMTNWSKIVISIVASFVVTLPSLSGDVLHYLILVSCVAFEANGIFKALHKS